MSSRNGSWGSVPCSTAEISRCAGTRGDVELLQSCRLDTSARRYKAMGRGRVFRLYVRNFWWETIDHRPKDIRHEDIRA